MTGTRVRPAAVAGLFYPRDPVALRQLVDQELLEAGAAKEVPPETVPKALIVPHAGYVYSGPVAASAWARISSAVRGRGDLSRVVVLGPAHRVPVRAVAVSRADAFATPLGLVRVDTAGRDELVAAGLVVVNDEAHASEHSLEVQLPFVQRILGDVAVLPLAVGQVATDDVARVIDAVWGGPETLIVVSTDLSHYLDRASAVLVDRITASAIVAKRPDKLQAGDACGVVAVRGLLTVARRRGLDVELLDLRTSADTAGDPQRVVGYGAFAVA